ncbi:DNA-3-methyladenine glycosylase family protein [Propionigenium maris]|nr:hypothetical protein [Propionigenium maris]
MKELFKLSEEAIEHLKRCERMAAVVEHLGEIEEREIVTDPFMGMVYNIIYQQVSFAAGNAIWRRWMERYRCATPESIVDAQEEEMRECGLSKSKVSYIKNLARAVLEDPRLMERDKLYQMSDEEISAVYTRIKGIGPWSVKMFLIFTMGREDIRSYGDLALRRGVEWLFGERDITEKRYLELTEGYSPYNTAATFYFWELTLKKVLKETRDYTQWREGLQLKGEEGC